MLRKVYHAFFISYTYCKHARHNIVKGQTYKSVGKIIQLCNQCFMPKVIYLAWMSGLNFIV